MKELMWRPSWLNYWKAIFVSVAFIVGGLVAMPFISSAMEEIGVTAWVVPLGGFVLAAFVMGRAGIDRFRRAYIVKPDGHVCERFGIIAKETDEVRVQDIRLLGVDQGIVQRIFGLGDVEIATAGHGEVEIHMRGIRDPEEVKEAIRKLQATLGGSDE